MKAQKIEVPNMEILSLDYVMEFLRVNYSIKEIKSVYPYSFTLGSNNNGEGLSLDFNLPRALFFGKLFISINPNDNPLDSEKIEIRYRSYFNETPYYKYITRQVETENLINESSESIELFDSLEITQESEKYDFYTTFIGFKIDLI